MDSLVTDSKRREERVQDDFQVSDLGTAWKVMPPPRSGS